ncbi:MAG: hypothetical protein GF411_00335 [Candidatus Lokiarchaeota archaeon]|nr:hypothetical protein [Candidatus Lokiarchaeota archaeon]
MGKRPLAHINSEMLEWARRERGYDIVTAAKKIGITPEKLKYCEEGEEQLTLHQLRNAAWVAISY